MKTAIKTAIASTSFATLLAFGAQSGALADYPEQDITLVVPFSAGGSTDIVGRIAGQGLAETLGGNVIIDNRGGAGGTVGTQAASRMEADGYHLTISTTSTHVVGPLSHDVAYDPVEGFDHIGLIGETPYVLVVNPDLPVENVQDLIDYAQENPGELNFGSAGEGSTTHLAGLMFLDATGVEMEHIPYPGNAEATTAVMSNEVQVLFGSMPAVLSQIRSESITPLAVGTLERSPQLPDVPTMQEAGVEDYRASLWLGLSAPAGVDPDILARLQEALEETLAKEDIAGQLSDNGAEPTVMGPEDFAALIREELETYGQIVN